MHPSYLIVGHCPACGAPIWSPANPNPHQPPPIMRSCDCGQEPSAPEPVTVRTRVFVDGFLLWDAIDQMLNHGRLRPRD